MGLLIKFWTTNLATYILTRMDMLIKIKPQCKTTKKQVNPTQESLEKLDKLEKNLYKLVDLVMKEERSSA